MALKQSAIAVCSHSNGLYPTSGFSVYASPPFGLRGSGRKTSPPPPTQTPLLRRYATVHHPHHGSSQAERSAGPSLLSWPSSADPTPYEILNLPKDGTYNKANFYELVKLYHPDHRHHAPRDGVPHLTKLERYRLVVAAHNVLSDPTKRRLYDSHGTGWTGRPELQESYRAADRTWRNQPGNASMNATWEDWEDWYRERSGAKQEPTFMSNGGFVGLILLFLVVAGWGQATRAGSNSMQLMDMRDRHHGDISRAMNKRQAENTGLSRHDRVESFLKQREGWELERHSGHVQDVKAKLPSH